MSLVAHSHKGLQFLRSLPIKGRMQVDFNFLIVNFFQFFLILFCCKKSLSITPLALFDPCGCNLLLLPGLKLILNNPFGGQLGIHSYSIETETTGNMEKHCFKAPQVI